MKHTRDKFILNEDTALHGDAFVDDDIGLGQELSDDTVVDTVSNTEVSAEVAKNANSDMITDLMRQQWDIINSCDSAIATIEAQDGIENKDAILKIIHGLVDATTESIGLTTKILSIINPEQEKLMSAGEKKAEEVINSDEVTEEPKEESLQLREKSIRGLGKKLEEEINSYDEDQEFLRDLELYEKYWVLFALSDIENYRDNLDEDGEDALITTWIDSLSDDEYIDFATTVADRIRDNDYMWETISDISYEAVRDYVSDNMPEDISQSVDVELDNDSEEEE